MFYFCAVAVFAQENAGKIALKIDKKTQFFEIADLKSKELLLYLRDEKNNTKVFKTNDSFKINDSISIETSDKIYTNYLGHTKTNDIYNIYWSNNRNELVFYQSMNFTSKENKSAAVTINLANEKVIKSFTIENKFFMISVSKKGNKLTFHEFINDKYNKKVVDFAGQIFYTSENEQIKLIWDVFNDGIFDIEIISNEIPTSLPLTASKRKVYTKNNKDLIFTFDNSPFVTQIVTINTEDYKYSIKNCPKTILPQTNGIGEYLLANNTNSFITNDKIFQIISNSDVIQIDIKNFNFENLKSYKVEKDKEITFINSEVFREVVSISTTKVLGKSSQLLRKLNNLPYLGLTAHFKDNQYLITFGGFSNILTDNNALRYGGMFGIVGALVAVALAPTYSMSNINSFKDKEVVYTNALFDESFNPIKLKLNTPAFDKLRLFMEQNTNLTNQMAFKFDNILYLGGYDKSTQLLSFYKFSD